MTLGIKSEQPNLATVRARRAEIADQRQLLDLEDSELEIAERVLQRLTSIGSNASSNDHPAPARPGLTIDARYSDATNGGIRISHADMVIGTLKGSADPWFESPKALHDEIARVVGIRIKNTSFQPLLSIMKTKGIIVRDGKRVALAERVDLFEQPREAAE